ncbi:Imm6 family immunity protein [Bacillus sp. DX4.1]|uniref:Imm6 family immunity protein n=1 Tax=Bacillus sp. DX4.1 TaxID=3055867 RepID=UPI0025A12DB4|nr:Imm6 family immunity protein [Bacillus sp. DX4.1]MDM5186296.1 Imm6 family immunity protein [Bacillus sp. DX4.1]
MNFIENLNEEAKVVIGLIIAERMFNLIHISEDGHKTGRGALDSCWQWLEGEEIEVADLYGYIDSEDYIDVVEFAHLEKDDKKQYAWYAVLDAVSYTIWQAYKKENRKFVPQAIEGIDDETLIILVENSVESKFFKLESIDKVKKCLLENYSISSEIQSNTIIKKDIMKMVDN